MRIHLDKKWVLTSDEKQYILNEVHYKSDGDVRLRAKSYFTSLEHLLKMYLNVALRTAPNIETLAQLFKKQEELSNQLRTALNNAGNFKVEVVRE